MVGFLFRIARFIGRRMDFKLLFFVNLPFSGLGSSFFNFCSFLFKINSIKTLISRWFYVCSNYKDMHCEFNFLKTFFTSNGFPVSLVNSNSKKFFQNRFVPSPLDSPCRKKFTYHCLILVISPKNFDLNCLNCCQSTFHLLIFILSLIITIKSGPSSHTKISYLAPCNPLWCIHLVVHSVHLSTSVQPWVLSTQQLLSIRVGASELEPFLLLLLILTLEPMHSLAAIALLQLTILIF